MIPLRCLPAVRCRACMCYSEMQLQHSSTHRLIQAVASLVHMPGSTLHLLGTTSPDMVPIHDRSDAILPPPTVDGSNRLYSNSDAGPAQLNHSAWHF